MNTSSEDDLADIVERIASLSGLELTDQAAAEVYRAFCQIGTILAPAIGMHLKNVCEFDQTRRVRLEEADTHRESSEIVRSYNSDVIARIIHDLMPAIAPAFPGREQTVGALVNDLRMIDPPLHLKALPKKDRGGAGHHFQGTRTTARALLYEIVVFEAARTQRSEKSVCLELTRTKFTEDNWKALVREQTNAGVDKVSFQTAGRDAGQQPHPRIKDHDYCKGLAIEALM